MENNKIFKSALIVVLVIALLTLIASSISATKANLAFEPDADNYQAVFLDNGEVYFGNMTESSDKFLVLENIYYLRVTPVLQQGPDGTVAEDPTQQPQINIVKLGEELHGPQDKMVIPITSVTYWEDLRDEGQVATAIQEAIDNPAPEVAEQDAATQPAPQQQLPANSPDQVQAPQGLDPVTNPAQ